MRTVYVETSVLGMVPPDQNPTLRRPTLEFLRRCERRMLLPHISDVVNNEIRKAAEAFNAVAILAGFPGKLEIHTPLEILEWI